MQSLVEGLCPDSYLGPWLRHALPFLADCLRQKAHSECRQLLESTTSRADALLQQAQIDAERLKDRAWQAIHLAIRELEA